LLTHILHFRAVFSAIWNVTLEYTQTDAIEADDRACLDVLDRVWSLCDPARLLDARSLTRAIPHSLLIAAALAPGALAQARPCPQDPDHDLDLIDPT